MTPVAQKITLPLKESQIEAYQLSSDGQIQLFFTHRQIGEAVGKTKEAAQRFLSQQRERLGAPVKARIPDKPHPVPLTSLEAALAYWESMAQLGNEKASVLIEALSNQTIEAISSSMEEKVIGEQEIVNNSHPITSSEEFHLIVEGIETASKWMDSAGVDQSARLPPARFANAHWKLTQLQKEVPQLGEIVTSAQSVIANSTVSPSGMIVSQLASLLTEQLGRKITAASVNKALHEMGLQDWSKPGQSRERKLTDSGKPYGVAVLATSESGWQGCQIRWNESVIPVLMKYLR
jgi:hypothetical protein